MIETKTCDICGQNKDMSEFNNDYAFIEDSTEKEVNVCKECE